MSKRQRSREEGQCAYCGQHDILTVDHVIPRCLFDGVTGGVLGNAPKVDACRQCNNAKSTDDTFLRDVLVRDLRLAEHSIAQALTDWFRAFGCRADTTERATAWYLHTARARADGRL